MKTAKEMFEELGFKKTKTYGRFIQFIKPCRPLNWDSEYSIVFALKEKQYQVCVANSRPNWTGSMPVSIPLYLAITQQMKELGWIE